MPTAKPAPCWSARDLHHELRTFFAFDQFTLYQERTVIGLPKPLPTYTNEFWTAKQRDGHSLHEISYRACYKPQLPTFFISRFCQPDDTVYDPFMGRGTTLIEAQLHRCKAVGNDINPVSAVFAAGRLQIPSLKSIQNRLAQIELLQTDIEDEELLVFFHPETLRELYGWRLYFRDKKTKGSFDSVDQWLQMIATNRLTGHSKGFFSVYTLPPNQATSLNAQRKINQKRNQTPEYRNTKEIIAKKSRRLLKDTIPRHFNRKDALILSESAESTPQIPDSSVKLVVTSPPFVDAVDYVGDNWLRLWFCEAQLEKEKLWQLRKVGDWRARMTDTLRELHRILRPDGIIAFEVGEVRKGKLLLEDEILVAALNAGLTPECIMINAQEFTKTANCWGIDNNTKGTNTNRIVILRP